jgi:HD-GYP domain-containing protein (c-di-GMP phosphodiesterase class II)
MTIETDLRHVIYALSDALDMVGVDDIEHGKRVGIMAAECLRRTGATDDEVVFMFDLGMLHDVGVSSTQTHRNLVREFDWTGSQEHCLIGAQRLSGFVPLAAMAEPVRYHHTRWEALLEQHINPVIARQANLIFMADRVDVMAAPYYEDGSVYLHVNEIRRQLLDRAGSYFSPDLVALFLDASASDAFWLMLDHRAIGRYLQDMLDRRPVCQTSMTELRLLAQIFADIVDAKSIFTARHSLGVAGLSRFLGERMGVDADHCDKLEIAGLLHDLGKLRVPDEILDKPGKLDDRERRIINTHSFETYQILRHIQGFEDITSWASCHHEEPGGHGYPFHLMGESLPLEARILRVADIFQAMVQRRPYRQGLSASEAYCFMKSLAEQGRVDREVVRVISNHLDAAMRVACP